MHPNCERLLSYLAKRDTLASAYLFFGQPGSGFDTAPEWVATRCLSASVPHPDIVTLPVDGSIKIEDIRAIQKEIQFGPRQGNWLFVHVPQAHLLTLQAANAFLKTLEEPPERVSLFLSTSQPQGLIPTIHSRCQKLFFPAPKRTLTSPTLTYAAFQAKKPSEKFLFAQDLAVDKATALETLYSWMDEIESQNQQHENTSIKTLEKIADKVLDLSYNVNLRLQLEALLLELTEV